MSALPDDMGPKAAGQTQPFLEVDGIGMPPNSLYAGQDICGIVSEKIMISLNGPARF